MMSEIQTIEKLAHVANHLLAMIDYIGEMQDEIHDNCPTIDLDKRQKQRRIYNEIRASTIDTINEIEVNL